MRADLQGQKITFIHVATETKAAEFYAERFRQETGAIVELQAAGFSDLLLSAEIDWRAAQPQADIFQLLYHDLGLLVEQGMVEDLSQFFADNGEVINPDDYINGVFDAFSLHQGGRYALPYDFDNHIVLYRKSLLAKHGLSPPTTWDEFTEIAKTITESESKNGIYGTAIMAHPSPMFVIGTYMNRLVTCGGALFADDGAPTLTSPESVQALSYLVEHAQYAIPDPVETDFDASRFAFLSGRVALVEQWTDVGIMAEDPSMSTIQGDWGAVQLPLGTGPNARAGTALNGGFVLALSSKAPHPEAARQFLLTVANRDNELQGNLINGGLDPTRKSVLTSSTYREFAPQVAEAKQASLERAVALPTGPRTPALLEALSDGLIRAIQGQLSPAEALADVEAKWNRTLALPAAEVMRAQKSH